jgi:hypothetical protein
VINNSTNINKTNNRTSPQSIEHKKRALHMAFEIQVMQGTGKKMWQG